MDRIEEIIADWATERPDIDCSGKEVICRMLYGFSKIISELKKSLKPLGIPPHVFSILVTIRRKGPHAEITVKQAMQEILITSGGMTNLLNKLINAGLIIKKKKLKASTDARSTYIKLTSKGLHLINQAMEIQAACEIKLTQGLLDSEKKQFSKLLKKFCKHSG